MERPSLSMIASHPRPPNARCPVAQLIVRNLEDEIVQALKRRAGRHGRSAEAEHRELLRSALLARGPGKSLKALLLEMPAAGEDSDFSRQGDVGRELDL